MSAVECVQTMYSTLLVAGCCWLVRMSDNCRSISLDSSCHVGSQLTVGCSSGTTDESACTDTAAGRVFVVVAVSLGVLTGVGSGWAIVLLVGVAM